MSSWAEKKRVELTLNINTLGVLKGFEGGTKMLLWVKILDPLLSMFHDATVVIVEPNHSSQQWLEWSRHLGVERYYVSRCSSALIFFSGGIQAHFSQHYFSSQGFADFLLFTSLWRCSISVKLTSHFVARALRNLHSFLFWLFSCWSAVDWYHFDPV